MQREPGSSEVVNLWVLLGCFNTVIVIERLSTHFASVQLLLHAESGKLQAINYSQENRKKSPQETRSICTLTAIEGLHQIVREHASKSIFFRRHELHFQILGECQIWTPE